jgi:hypothetical protein
MSTGEKGFITVNTVGLICRRWYLQFIDTAPLEASMADEMVEDTLGGGKFRCSSSPAAWRASRQRGYQRW